MFGNEFGGKPSKCFGESCLIGKNMYNQDNIRFFSSH